MSILSAITREWTDQMTMKDKIKQYIVDEIIIDGSGAELTDKSPLIDSGIISSVGIMALIGFIEESFSIEIGADELIPENFATIETMSELIEQKQNLGG